MVETKFVRDRNMSSKNMKCVSNLSKNDPLYNNSELLFMPEFENQNWQSEIGPFENI